MTAPLLEILGEPPILFDGAMGSALMAAGLPAGAAPETWNLENPDAIIAIHRNFFDAGSRVVQTNSFGASRPKLKSAGLADRVEEVNARAVEIARTAADTAGGLVAGDIGPSGLLLEPLGDTSAEELEDVFAEQAAALWRAGADLISIETMYDLAEASCALRGAKRAVPIPVIVSMTFERRDVGFVTVMGNDADASLKQLAADGADGVGSNCSLGSADMIALAESLCSGDPLPVPLLLQPNAGQPRMEGATAVYDQTPESFATDGRQILAAGAATLGGCCGTTPAFLRALADSL